METLTKTSVLTLLLCWAASSAVAAPQTIVKEERRSMRVVQETAQSLESLIGRTAELQARLQDAVDRARKAETPEEERELTQRLITIESQFKDVSAEFAKRVATLRDATDPIKTKILAALKLSDLDQVEKELEGIEAELEDEDAASEDVARRLLGLAKYYIAENMRERGVRLARSTKDDIRAAKILRQAVSKYQEVLEKVDVSVPEVGDSLHAAAWHQIAHVEASLYVGYKELVRLKHNVDSNSSKMRRHRNAADKALSELQRLHEDAQYADGRRVVDVAAADVRRLLR